MLQGHATCSTAVATDRFAFWWRIWVRSSCMHWYSSSTTSADPHLHAAPSRESARSSQIRTRNGTQ